MQDVDGSPGGTVYCTVQGGQVMERITYGVTVACHNLISCDNAPVHVCRFDGETCFAFLQFRALEAIVMKQVAQEPAKQLKIFVFEIKAKDYANCISENYSLFYIATLDEFMYDFTSQCPLKHPNHEDPSYNCELNDHWL